MPERTVFKKGFINWRTADFYMNSWVDDPPRSTVQEAERIPLHEVLCPRCGGGKKMRGNGQGKTGWLYYRCNKCSTKFSAQHWRCGCGNLWHTCPKHILVNDMNVNDKPKKVKKRKFTDIRGNGRRAPGPEPKVARQSQPEESQQVATQRTARTWKLDPSSVLGMRFPHLATDPVLPS